MANCFRCGKQLSEHEPRRRRRVVTGGSERKSYPRSHLRETQARFGMRIVCTRCAKFIDLQQGRLTQIEDLKLYAALAALLIVIVLLWTGVLTW
jgi:hypothetical protein